ncbi:MAG: cytochrome c [Sulfurospirillum sp.]
MRVLFVVFLLVVSVFAEDFITKMEYAKMLYYNPRGIGCNLCHGKSGQGSIIARYKNKGKRKVLRAPKISRLGFVSFSKALKKRHKVMPTYFLTDKEIAILYFYVTSKAEK